MGLNRMHQFWDHQWCLLSVGAVVQPPLFCSEVQTLGAHKCTTYQRCSHRAQLLQQPCSKSQNLQFLLLLHLWTLPASLGQQQEHYHRHHQQKCPCPLLFRHQLLLSQRIKTQVHFCKV